MRNKKKFNRKVLKLKEELTDTEIFGSIGYVNLLKSVSKEISFDDFEEILTYECPEEPHMGWCDGQRIGINVGNEITKGFQTVKLRHDSIIGILGHECGHKNFSNHFLREKYIKGIIEEGKLYPHLPLPENEMEGLHLAQIREYLKEKDKVALAVLAEVAAYINNVLEDYYIEEKMSALYPGSIRMGILQNRTRNVERIPSLSYQIAQEYEEYAIILNLLSQYTLSQTINNWDGYSGELIEVLNRCKPMIDKAITNEGESVRFIATNQLLLKIWNFLGKKIEEIKTSIKDSEEQTAQETDETSASIQEDNQESDPFLEQAMKEFGRQFANKIQMQDEQEQQLEQGEPPKDVPWDGGCDDEKEQGKTEDSNTETEICKKEQRETQSAEALTDEQDQTISDESMDSTGFMFSANEANDSENSDETDDTYNTEDGTGNDKIQTKEEKIDGVGESTDIRGSLVATEENEVNVDDALMDILLGLATEKAEKQSENMILSELIEQIHSMPFTSPNEEVQKLLVRSNEINEVDRKAYEAVAGSVKKVMKRLRTKLIPILEKKENNAERGLFIGKQLDASHILNPQGKIFQKKNQPEEELDTVIGVLVDQSASMSDYKRLEYAKLTALCLYEFSCYTGIPIIIYGHHTDGYEHRRLQDETVYLHTYVEFESSFHDKYRIMGMKANGANRDGTALSFLGERLSKRTERAKILVLICDGLPNSNGYRGEAAKEDLRNIKRMLNKQGILLLVAAIGMDKDKIKDIYQESYLDISDIEQMPTEITKQVMKRIRRIL